VELGAVINKENRDCVIPLIMASSRKNEDLVKYLVEHIKDNNNKNIDGKKHIIK